MARDARVHSHRREQWSGQAGFVLAAIGSAVGLGNIWRFPGVAYTNGGGAFLLPYLVALLTAGIPILFVDYALGHRFRGAPPTVFCRIRKHAEFLGWFQVAICFIIILYYAVIIAWAGSYALFSLTTAWGNDAAGFFTGDFLQLSKNPDLHLEIVSNVALPLLAVWAVTIFILALGVQRGLEKANLFFIPLLALLFTALVARALFLDGAIDGLNAFFTPNWGALADPGVWLAAYAQVFFSLSIAFGIMITYSSYLQKKSNLSGTGLVVAFANSSFEILAGIGVFSTLGFMAQTQGVSVAELDYITGVMLSFVTFPTIVATMSGGPIFGFLFFASLTVAGITSLLSLLQVVSGAFQDKFGISARRAAVGIGSVAAVLSLAFFARHDGLRTLDVVDKWTNEVGIVGSAIVMLVLLLSWGQVRVLGQHINAHSSCTVGWIWTVMVSFVVPVVLLWMFISGVINVLTEPYSGNPTWYNTLFGWGSIALMLVLAGVFSIIRWRLPVDDFTPEPTLPGEQIHARAGGSHRGKDES